LLFVQDEGYWIIDGFTIFFLEWVARLDWCLLISTHAQVTSEELIEFKVGLHQLVLLLFVLQLLIDLVNEVL
jgi:hypothetical protein